MSIQTDSGRFPVERIGLLERTLLEVLGLLIAPTRKFSGKIDGDDIVYYEANTIKFGRTYYLSQDVLEISNPETHLKTTIGRHHVKHGFEYVMKEQSQGNTVTYRPDFVVVQTPSGVLTYYSNVIMNEKDERINDENLRQRYYDRRIEKLAYAMNTFNDYLRRIENIKSQVELR